MMIALSCRICISDFLLSLTFSIESMRFCCKAAIKFAKNFGTSILLGHKIAFLEGVLEVAYKLDVFAILLLVLLYIMFNILGILFILFMLLYTGLCIQRIPVNFYSTVQKVCTLKFL